MKRFYLLLGAVAVGGGLFVFLASRSGGGAASAPGAAIPSPPAGADDGFRGWTLGTDAAPVEVVEYLDFECPACQRFAVLQMPTIREQLIATGKVRWRTRDFPLVRIHANALYAAHAAQCAGEQGRFWEMHDQLFYNHSWSQTGRNVAGLFEDMAKAAGVDVDAYEACMDSRRYQRRIEDSVREGEAVGVQGTPTFLANGRLVPGIPTSDEFKALVERLATRR